MTPVHPIEAESYRVMAERVDLSGWPDGPRQVVARMIHASADVGYAASARIGAEAVARAGRALARGAPVIVDAAMVAAGAPGVATICLLADVPVAPGGSTRAAGAVDLAARRHPHGALWVIGNAPTALARLLALHAHGEVDPAAVIGLPVGFVGAAEAKAELWAGPLAPRAVTNAGELGGSAVAAAALNALHRLCQGDDPC